MYNPRLSDLFFWHFHPEYELVYITGATGPRHVGEHLSTYQGSDLVLIGSNIPHLNFDYGVNTEYQKAVVHFRKDFVEKHLSGIPEFATIKKLFHDAQKGIVFSEEAKKLVGEKLFQLKSLTPIDQYLLLVDILFTLSKMEGKVLLHKHTYRNQYSSREQERMQQIYHFIDQNYHRKIELMELAHLSCMTKEAFCRYFKKMTKYTFTEFLNRYRISLSKRSLIAGNSISEACFSSGFGSLSYYNRVFKQVTNENPTDFKRNFFASKNNQ